MIKRLYRRLSGGGSGSSNDAASPPAKRPRGTPQAAPPTRGAAHGGGGSAGGGGAGGGGAAVAAEGGSATGPGGGDGGAAASAASAACGTLSTPSSPPPRGKVRAGASTPRISEQLSIASLHVGMATAKLVRTAAIKIGHRTAHEGIWVMKMDLLPVGGVGLPIDFGSAVLQILDGQLECTTEPLSMGTVVGFERSMGGVGHGHVVALIDVRSLKEFAAAAPQWLPADAGPGALVGLAPVYAMLEDILGLKLLASGIQWANVVGRLSDLAPGDIVDGEEGVRVIRLDNQLQLQSCKEFENVVGYTGKCYDQADSRMWFTPGLFERLSAALRRYLTLVSCADWWRLHGKRTGYCNPKEFAEDTRTHLAPFARVFKQLLYCFGHVLGLPRPKHDNATDPYLVDTRYEPASGSGGIGTAQRRAEVAASFAVPAMYSHSHRSVRSTVGKVTTSYRPFFSVPGYSSVAIVVSHWIS